MNGQLSISDYGVAGRGGPVPPRTVAEAVQLFEEHKGDEQHILRVTLLRRCWTTGTAHSDDLRHLPVTKANGIGAAVNALLQMGLIHQVGRRASRFPAAHGRTSGVYALTAKGEVQAALL